MRGSLTVVVAIVVGVIGGVVPLPGIGRAAAQNAARERPPLQYAFDQEAISKKILANTDESVGQAVAEISQLLGPTTGMQGAYATIVLRWKWGDEFLKVRRYEQLLPLCKLGIFRMAHERTYHASGLQRMRVLCLLGLGRKTEALSHAKLYYNMCVTAETAEAVKLLIRCLREAHPGDEKIVEQFKAEQIAGAELTNDPPEQAARDRSVLARIALPTEDADDYRKEIAILANTNMNDTPARTALGNFLLMAGRSEEAVQVFQDALEGDLRDNAAADMLENVAIAIRACDGTIGRGNAYIMANQGDTAAPSP
jgi:hypothetical protein